MAERRLQTLARPHYGMCEFCEAQAIKDADRNWKYYQGQGWTSQIVGVDEYFICGQCNAAKARVE